MVGYTQRKSINPKNVTNHCVRKTPIKRWGKKLTLLQKHKFKRWQRYYNLPYFPTKEDHELVSEYAWVQIHFLFSMIVFLNILIHYRNVGRSTIHVLL